MQRRLWLLGWLAGWAALSCSPETNKNQEIFGNWHATQVLEEGRPLAVDTQQIRFHFDADATYRFQSTLNYREAGRYQLENGYLFTTDTLHQASEEKAVQILKLSPDSLHLRMQEAGKERLLKLVRDGE